MNWKEEFMYSNKMNRVWIVCIPALLMIFLGMLIPYVYAIVDDRTMMEIVSGQYLGHPDAHLIFVGYWYSLIIAGLYRMLPNVDWYALGYLVLQAGCMGLILYRLYEKRKKDQKMIWTFVTAALIFLFLLVRTITQITFTTTAAVLGVTAVFWYLTAEKIRIRDLVILFVLCFLTFEVRSDVFFMILPVCGLQWLFRVWEGSGREKYHLLLPLVIGTMLLLELSGSILGYGSRGWQKYDDYTTVRSQIYDYDEYMFPRIEDEEELYRSLGIEEKSRAKTLYYYNFTADDEIDMDFFSEYLEARQKTVFPEKNHIFRIAEAFGTYGKWIAQGKLGYRHVFGLLLYFLLLVQTLRRKAYRSSLKTVLALGLQMVLWVYLIFRGRTPERVLFSMNLMLITVGAVLWMEETPYIQLQEKTEKIGKGALFCVLVFLSGLGIWQTRMENLASHHENERIEAIKEYCMEHPENFYFNDVTSFALTTYNFHLWQKEPYRMNYMSLGDWIAYSPLWEEKLGQQGITSVKEALYRWDQVYLISSFDKGTEYLAALYDGTVCTEADEIRGFHIYKLQSE